MRPPFPQAEQLKPLFPVLQRDRTVARLAFYEELLAEGAYEIILSALTWGITAPPHLDGEARLQYLAGKVAEAEFPPLEHIAACAA